MDTPATIDPSTRRRGAVFFALLAAGIAVALGLLAEANRERIARNEQAWLESRLVRLLASVDYDNDPLTDRIDVTAPDDLGTDAAVPVFRARQDGEPAALVLLPYAAGYAGPIRLMIAIDPAGRILGVDVLDHRETPGLGDAFAARGSRWLAAFTGMALQTESAVPARWNVRKDGGDFDAFTGATITPRAIIKAVERTLDYHRKQRDRLYVPS